MIESSMPYLIEWARKAPKGTMQLAGGFQNLLTDEPHPWQDDVPRINVPQTHVPRVVPAANAMGLQHWSHATALDLLAYVYMGCPHWAAEHLLLAAFGSLYRQAEVPVAIRNNRTGIITLTTQQLQKVDTSDKRVRRLLQLNPDARALCWVPKAR